MSNLVDRYVDSEKGRAKLLEKIEPSRNLFTAFNTSMIEIGLPEDNFDEIEIEREEVTNPYNDALAAAIVL